MRLEELLKRKEFAVPDRPDMHPLRRVGCPVPPPPPLRRRQMQENHSRHCCYYCGVKVHRLRCPQGMVWCRDEEAHGLGCIDHLVTPWWTHADEALCRRDRPSPWQRRLVHQVHP